MNKSELMYYVFHAMPAVLSQLAKQYLSIGTLVSMDWSMPSCRGGGRYPRKDLELVQLTAHVLPGGMLATFLDFTCKKRMILVVVAALLPKDCLCMKLCLRTERLHTGAN